MGSKRPRIALLINLLAPYRVCVYDEIAKEADLRVFLSGSESNRTNWHNLADGKAWTAKRAWGFTLTLNRRKAGEVFDKRFLHITPGFFWELVKCRPDAVISIEMGFRSLAALLYGTLFRRPVWIWWGGTLHTEQDVGGFKRRMRGWIARWATRWISYGQTSTEYLESLGVPRERILQIQNCVDHRRFSPDALPRFTGLTQPVLLHVGQLIARKGLSALVDAAAQLESEGEKFTLLLVGGGPDRDALEVQAREAGLTQIRFEPPISPAEMPGVYTSADVLVFPTREDVWGLVANEAILCGVPVLCSKWAGCAPEVVPPENIFEPGDPDEFVAALRRAVRGEIAAADPARLVPFETVAQRILDGVRA